MFQYKRSDVLYYLSTRKIDTLITSNTSFVSPGKVSYPQFEKHCLSGGSIDRFPQGLTLSVPGKVCSSAPRSVTGTNITEQRPFEWTWNGYFDSWSCFNNQCKLPQGYFSSKTKINHKRTEMDVWINIFGWITNTRVTYWLSPWSWPHKSLNPFTRNFSTLAQAFRSSIVLMWVGLVTRIQAEFCSINFLSTVSLGDTGWGKSTIQVLSLGIWKEKKKSLMYVKYFTVSCYS